MELNDYGNRSTSGAAVVAGGMGTLKNPIMIPQQVVLKKSVALGATNQLYIADACGLSAALGSTGGANSAEFEGVNGITPAIIKEFLKTNALIIGGYNFESTDPQQLVNNLKAIYSCLDGNSSSRQLQSSLSISNMQQNPNLLNVDQNFVWDNMTALRIAIDASAAAVSYTFTFAVLGAVAYGKLDEFLALKALPERSRLNC